MRKLAKGKGRYDRPPVEKDPIDPQPIVPYRGSRKHMKMQKRHERRVKAGRGFRSRNR